MMANHFLRETLGSIGAVLPDFRHVRVDWERLNFVAEENALMDYDLPCWDFSGCYPQSDEAALSHFFWGNVINFCFDHSRGNGDGELLKFKVRNCDGKIISGSFGMQSCFYRTYKELPITTEDLKARIGTFSKFEEMFRGVDSSMPLLSQRWEMLNEAIVVLENRFGGQVQNLLEEGCYRAFGEGGGTQPGMVELLVDYFPNAFGDDKFIDYKGCFNPPGKAFYFYKRAQLFVMMYHGRALRSGGKLKSIDGIEEIGPLVDYIIPKRYVADSVLVYGDELREKIERALPIERHSREVLEIRLGTYLAFWKELEIINKIRAMGCIEPIHVGHLDYRRFSRSDGGKFKHYFCPCTDC